MYISHLPTLVYPMRVGEYANTAFGLTFAWDYAVHFEGGVLVGAIRVRARTFYLEDKECPLAWEPNGYEFLSPCLEEVDLTRRVLSESEFIVWVKDFLPQLLNAHFSIDVGEVSDRTDDKLVHLDVLNFSCAWMFGAIARQYP